MSKKMVTYNEEDALTQDACTIEVETTRKERKFLVYRIDGRRQ